MSAAMKRYRYLRRLLKFDQMDFEFAIWQMTYLFINPQKVYRNFQYRKQTKSQFARDDPAFFVLLLLWLFIASVGFTFVLQLSVVSFIKFNLYIVFVDCILVGLCIATFLWFLSNKYLLKPSSVGQDVEWGYAFDVHLNAFFPPLVILHVIQLFFYNVFISKDWFISRLFGNSLWLISFIYYLYITFLGYSSLQILHKTQVLLSPVIPLLFVYAMTVTLGWNVTESVMNFYMYRVA
ncbi:protein unc-50 homolog isoform X2 [Cimex lectularius]|nr:protein unc-50 homolog isoform X2 [Cimex lectularius]XP_024083732.1 protein unc-50 homolog isoform X2 [Cimex lectularius]